jgi:hypothetical protein
MKLIALEDRLTSNRMRRYGLEKRISKKALSMKVEEHTQE